MGVWDIAKIFGKQKESLLPAIVTGKSIIKV